jgi:hypothetical protein
MPNGQAVTQRVDCAITERITAPAHNVQHRAKNFGLHVTDGSLQRHVVLSGLLRFE